MVCNIKGIVCLNFEHSVRFVALTQTNNVMTVPSWMKQFVLYVDSLMFTQLNYLVIIYSATSASRECWHVSHLAHSVVLLYHVTLHLNQKLWNPSC